MYNPNPRVIKITRKWPYPTLEFKIDEDFNISCKSCEDKGMQCMHPRNAINDSKIVKIFSDVLGCEIPTEVIDRINHNE